MKPKDISLIWFMTGIGLLTLYGLVYGPAEIDYRNTGYEYLRPKYHTYYSAFCFVFGFTCIVALCTVIYEKNKSK